MEKDTMLKTIGIIIIVVMAASMIAAALIYQEPAAATATVNPLDAINAPPINYTTSFDGKIIQGTDKMQLIVTTSIIEKNTIDAAVNKVQGISKFASAFQKSPSMSGYWLYIADITLKKDADPNIVAKEIIDLNFFSKEQGSFEALKTVTISPPEKVLLFNADLNITRDFNFESKTLPALVDLRFVAGDSIAIDGKIQMVKGSPTQLFLYSPVVIFSASKASKVPFDFNALEARVAQEGIAAGLQFDNNPSKVFRVSFDGNVPADFNASVKAIAGVEDVFINDKDAYIQFAAGSAYIGFAAVEKLIQDNGYFASTTYPPQEFAGIVNSYFALNQIKKLCSDNGFVIKENKSTPFLAQLTLNQFN